MERKSTGRNSTKFKHTKVWKFWKMLFHSGIVGLEIQTEILDVVESTLHQNALRQPTLLGSRELLALHVSIRRGTRFETQQVS